MMKWKTQNCYECHTVTIKFYEIMPKMAIHYKSVEDKSLKA